MGGVPRRVSPNKKPAAPKDRRLRRNAVIYLLELGLELGRLMLLDELGLLNEP